MFHVEQRVFWGRVIFIGALAGREICFLGTRKGAGAGEGVDDF